MTRDLSHLLLTDTPGCGCSAAGCGASGSSYQHAHTTAWPVPEEVPGGPDALYWNLFAYPVTVDTRRYAFLTDVRSVLTVDEATFRDLKDARGGKLAAAVPPDRLERLLTLGLVQREPARSQFEKVFAGPARARQENKLLHLITS